MPDDDVIPLNGIPVRVFSNLLQQAVEHMDMTRGDYVTFVVVGTQAVSLYTGTRPRPRLITHDKPTEEVTERPKTARLGKGPKKKRGYRKGGTFIDVDLAQITGYFLDDPHKELSALMVGDLMNLPRASPERQNLSRVLAEMRLSGIIRPTTDSRIPNYVLANALPRVQIGRDLSEDNVERLMQQVGRPMAFGIIGDIMSVRRSDRTDRVVLSGLLKRLVNDRRLRYEQSPRENIAIYSIA